MHVFALVTTNTSGAYCAFEDPPTLIRRRPQNLERRSAVRLPLEIDVTVEGAARSFEASTLDFSPGGLFLATNHRAPLGSNLVLSFTLPNGTDVEVLGTVAWERDDGMGFSFFCLAPETKELLDAFCEVREPLYYA